MQIHYQHGKVKIKGNNVSVAFTFRVSPHTCECDLATNKVVIDEETMNDIKLK